MSSEMQKPLVEPKEGQVAEGEPQTGKEKCKSCCKYYGKKAAFYCSILALIVFILMWILQFILSGIYYWGCSKNSGLTSDIYKSGDCDVADCKGTDFPSSAYSKYFGPEWNIMHQNMLLKEADKSFWGSGFEVYDMRGDTNDPRGAAIGKWWRKWGPWWNTYYYQQIGDSWPKTVYMREKLLTFSGETHVIGRCDEKYDPYIVMEGPHWLSNIFVPFSVSGKGLQFDVNNDNKLNATMIETSARNSIYFKQNGVDKNIATASQHKDSTPGEGDKSEWNIDNEYVSSVPYYVPNAMTVLLAFVDYNEKMKQRKEAEKAEKEKERREAEKNKHGVRQFYIQAPASAGKKIEQVKLALAQGKQAVTQLRGVEHV